MADTIFKKPILIFSEYCKYSNNFLQILTKYPEIYNSFIRMNIDTNPVTKKRPELFYKIQQLLGTKISKIPTIITPGGESILSDKDAFKWLEFQINNLTNSKKASLVGFNPAEMVSFSDHYSKVGSTELNDATEQSYKFFIDVNNNGKTEKILPNDNYSNSKKSWDSNTDKTHGFLDDIETTTSNMDHDYNSLQSERQYFDDEQNKQTSALGNMPFKKESNQHKVNHQEYTSFSKNRDQVSSSTPNNQAINFTDPSFGLSGKLSTSKYNNNNNNNNNISIKSKELDSKLAVLQKDREMMDSTLQQKR